MSSLTLDARLKVLPSRIATVNTLLVAAAVLLWCTPWYNLPVKALLVWSLVVCVWAPGALPEGAGRQFLLATLAFVAVIVSRDSMYEGAFSAKAMSYLALIPAWLNLCWYGLRTRVLLPVALLSAGVAGLSAWVVSDGLALRIGMGRNEISYAGAALSLGILAGYAALRSPEWPVWFKLPLSLGAIIALVSAGTRGAYVSVLLVIAVVILHGAKAWPLRRLLLIGGGCVILIASGLMVSGRWVATLVEFKTILSGSLETSIGHRLMLWQLGWQVWLDHPLLGFGNAPEAINVAYAEFLRVQHFNPDIIRMHHHFHNQYVDLLAKYGLMGLVSWLVWLVCAVRAAPEASRLLAAMFMVGLMGLALTESIMGTNSLRYTLLLVMLLPLGWSRRVT